MNAQDAGGNTALMGVAFKGYADIAQLLIEQGADLNLQHGNGGTALMFAAIFGRNELVKLLLAHGADKFILDSLTLLLSKIMKKPYGYCKQEYFSKQQEPELILQRLGQRYNTYFFA